MSKSNTHTGDFAVYLSSVLALRVGVLRRSHFQHAHAEGVDINGLVVVFLVHFRCHELRRAWREQKGLLTLRIQQCHSDQQRLI